MAAAFSVKFVALLYNRMPGVYNQKCAERENHHTKLVTGHSFLTFQSWMGSGVRAAQL